MTTKKTYRKAVMLQKITRLLGRYYKFKYRKTFTEKFVSTQHGDIRVVEFGFDEPRVQPLYVDLHGGGFVLQTADVDTPMNLYVKERTDVKIISIDYPKAPQNQYPIPLEAVYEVIKYYIENAKNLNIDPDRVGIGGHSAGGVITAASCLKAKKEKDINFKLQILAYPPTDLSINPDERPKYKKAIPPKMIQMFNECYYDDDSELSRNPYVSPLFSTKDQLAGQPTALMFVAGLDSLHDEGVRYAKALKSAGVKLVFHDFKESVHGFTQYGKQDAIEAYDIMIDFINKNI